MIRHKYGLDYSIVVRKVSIEDSALLNEFECENATIQNFLRYYSLYDKRNVTYIFIDEENKIIVGFCSIRCTGISATDYRKDNTPYNYTFPAIEIDFFAVDERYRSIPLEEGSSRYATLSQALFLYMINCIKMIASGVVGATHICLYAVPQAKNFYKRCDFVEFESYMNREDKPFVDNCIPMFYEI